MENNSSEIMALPTAETDGVFSGYKELSRHGAFVLGTVCWHGHVWFVKSLCAELGQSSEARMLLLKEYEILLSFNHPGVVKVVALKEISGVGLSMLMEYVGGVHLDEYLDEYLGGAGRRQRVLLARRLLEAMAYIHSKGVAHLDLKPENILVSGASDNPRVTVIDFNLSDAAQYSRGKTIGGNRAYSAPEQWEAGYVASPRADVFSLGKLLEEIKPGILWRSIARRAVKENPEERFADASGMLAAHDRRLRCLRVAAVAVGIVICAIVIFIPKEKPAQAPVVPQAVMKTDSVVRERELSPEESAPNVAASPESPEAQEAPVVKMPAAIPEDPLAAADEKYTKLYEQWLAGIVRSINDETMKYEALLKQADALSYKELDARYTAILNSQGTGTYQEQLTRYLKSKGCPDEILKKHPYWGSGMEPEMREALRRCGKVSIQVSHKIVEKM